jgi:ABC-type glycerol-3-phosphate transport system substrate-binding protein
VKLVRLSMVAALLGAAACASAPTASNDTASEASDPVASPAPTTSPVQIDDLEELVSTCLEYVPVG